MVTDIGLLSAAISLVGCGIGAAYAEASIGAASVGMMSEDKNRVGHALLMTVIPESIAIFGFVTAMIIIFVV